jgi:hypothetical protein
LKRELHIVQRCNASSFVSEDKLSAAISPRPEAGSVDIVGTCSKAGPSIIMVYCGVSGRSISKHVQIQNQTDIPQTKYAPVSSCPFYHHTTAPLASLKNYLSICQRSNDPPLFANGYTNQPFRLVPCHIHLASPQGPARSSIFAHLT